MKCKKCNGNISAVFGAIPDDIGIMKIGGLVKNVKFIARKGEFVRVLCRTNIGITHHYLDRCNRCGYCLSDPIDENRRVDL